MMDPNPLPLYNGATRKQNVACDACRAKKIRCKRMTIAQTVSRLRGWPMALRGWVVCQSVMW